MSINRYKPHILVLPEDSANEKIANGFLLFSNVNPNVIQVERPTDGWTKAIDKFIKKYVDEMYQFPETRLVLLTDFDHRSDRFSYIENYIPKNLKKRVFILGVKTNPEQLKKVEGKTFREIGKTLAEECYNNRRILWEKPLLKDNEDELKRLSASVKPFLFSDS